MTSRKGDTPTPRPDDDDSEPTATAIEPGAVAEERTEEWNVEAMGDEFVELSAPASADTSGRAIVARVIEDGSTGALAPSERAFRRARRDTVPSVVPSMLAKSMRPSTVVAHRPAPAPAPAKAPAPAPAAAPAQAVPSTIGALPTAPAALRDPAAPTIEHAEVTRRVHDPDLDGPFDGHSAEYGVEVVSATAVPSVHTAPTAEQVIPALAPVAALVKKACFCLDVGDVAQAVTAAAAALAAGEASSESNIANLTDTATGPLARIFTAGPISKVPVMNRTDSELDSLELDELHWALLRRLDGKTTFDEVFRATKIPAIDALKIAAALLREGVIRVDDRARA